MKLADVCVARPVFAVMLIAFLVTLGIFSYRTLGVDLFLRADPATVYVGVELPGASPEEVTRGVFLRLEDAIPAVRGLDEMPVYRGEGIPRLICTFVLERDIEGAAQDIREKVSGALNRLPPNILPPVIRKLDPDSDPILTVLVAGPMSRRELTEIADKQVRRAIQTVNGVGEVDITGGQARQIRIFIDAERLTAHGLTVADVRDAVQRENVEAPGGHLIRGPQDLGLRTLGRVDSAGQFANIIVAMRGGAPVRVREVGQVEDGAEELRTWAMLLRKDHVPRDAVSVSVLRQSGTNTVRVADNVKRRLETLKLELPPGVHLEVVQDISVFIKASVHSLLEHLVLGSFLASLVVLLFIRNWRAVLIAALAIPTSIIATFTLMRYMDFSLNNMTLLALTLAVGIVIDDAIIVLENIFRYMEEKGVAEAGRGRGHSRNRAGGDGHHALAGDHLPADRVYERLCAALRQLLRLDDGHGHPGLFAGELHADADDELPDPRGGGQRWTRALAGGEVFPRHREFLLAQPGVGARAPRHGIDDLPGHVCLQLLFLSPGGPRLHPCRRPERAAELARSSRRQLAGAHDGYCDGDGASHRSPARGRVRPALHPRHHQPRPPLHPSGRPEPAQTHARADGPGSAPHPGQLSQRHLQRAPPFDPGRRAVVSHSRHHSRAGYPAIG